MNGQEPVASIVSAIIRRRHLTQGQRAMLLVDLSKLDNHAQDEAAVLLRLSLNDGLGRAS